MMTEGFAVFAVAAALFIATPVFAADCNAPPGPGVNWQRCYLDGRDLSGHNLDHGYLVDTSFARSDLSKTILADANAYRAKFISARLPQAKLDGGSFVEADFTKADLSNATLRNTDLRRARFFKANLRGADLSGARTDGADLTFADLSGATWSDGKQVCAEGSIGQCD
jgi:uncharacterized protein YjbI with pentapeptide repeats